MIDCVLDYHKSHGPKPDMAKVHAFIGSRRKRSGSSTRDDRSHERSIWAGRHPHNYRAPAVGVHVNCDRVKGFCGGGTTYK